MDYLCITQTGHTLNLADFTVSLAVALFSIIMIFASCSVGEMVTSRFDLFDVEFNQCKWYLYPMEIKRILVMILLNNQQPVIIKGYANTVCRREAFERVIFLMKYEKENYRANLWRLPVIISPINWVTISNFFEKNMVILL